MLLLLWISAMLDFIRNGFAEQWRAEKSKKKKTLIANPAPSITRPPNWDIVLCF